MSPSPSAKAKTIEDCGFAVKAKYPIGTRFFQTLADYGGQRVEGRVVGFDGDYYQIYFPAIAQDCRPMKESELDRLIPAEPHQRPSSRDKPSISPTKQNEEQYSVRLSPTLETNELKDSDSLFMNWGEK